MGAPLHFDSQRPSALLETVVGLRSEPARTAERIRLLDDYMASHVIDDRHFVCSSARACMASHAGQFFEGQLHHVGTHYDLMMDDRPLRIAVVGQEYGNGPAFVSREDRTRDVVIVTGYGKRFRSDGTHEARNPHMRGTTSLLRLLFGRQPGTDYTGELLNLDGKQVHLFEAFALTNFLLCSAIDAGQGTVGSKRGKSTSTIQKNCTRHFREVLRILEPTVVIAQGKGVRTWLNAALSGVSPVTTNLEQAEVHGHNFLLATFSHPSVPSGENWGSDERRPYLMNVVAPTVSAILSLCFANIPTVRDSRTRRSQRRPNEDGLRPDDACSDRDRRGATV